MESREKQIIAGVVVLAGLGGLVYRQMKEDAKIGSPQSATADLPTISTSEEVDKISITNGDKGEVVLEKKGDKWEVTKPVQAPANQANVKSLLENLKELKAKEVIARDPPEDLKKNYELDPSKGVHVVAWKGADKKLDDTFGKSGGRGEIMMLEGKPVIYAAGGYSSYLYTREVKSWRDTEVLKFDDANVTQLQIENAKASISCTKGDKWACTNKGQPIARFDEDKVRDALRALHAVNADDFADGKSASETGLDKPEGTATVTLKDGAGKFTLKVGKAATGTSRYAQKDGDATQVVIGGWIADWVVGAEDKFEKPKDAGAPAGKDAGASKT